MTVHGDVGAGLVFFAGWCLVAGCMVVQLVAADRAVKRLHELDPALVESAGAPYGTPWLPPAERRSTQDRLVAGFGAHARLRVLRRRRALPPDEALRRLVRFSVGAGIVAPVVFAATLVVLGLMGAR